MLRQTPEYYEDAHGNKIIGKYEGLKFCFSGFGSVIEIGDNVRFRDTCIYINNDSKIVIGDDGQFVESRIFIHHSSKVVFGSEVHLTKTEITMGDEAGLEMKYGCGIAWMSMNIGKGAEVILNDNSNVHSAGVLESSEGLTDWRLGENAKLEIGKRGNFYGGGMLWLYKNAVFRAGDEFRINRQYRFVLSIDTSILIGNDCLFSFSISMWSNDCHSIFDIAARKNINSLQHIRRERKIIIGNHVWVGDCAEILYDTEIGNGSIIGAMSLVKSRIPNNCIAAGVPARIIRKNVAWCGQDGAEEILECGQEYIHDTNE